MGYIELFNLIRKYIIEWPNVKLEALDFSSCSQAENTNDEYYDVFKQRICMYLYGYLEDEEISEMIYSSFKRLANAFLTKSEPKLVNQKLDTFDLFVLLEILDSELVVSSNTSEYCNLYKDDISGRYRPGKVECHFGYSVYTVSRLIESIISKFNSENIYLQFEDIIASKEGPREVFISRYTNVYEIHRKKPDVMVNKIHLSQFEAESKMDIERSFEVLLFSKIIGMIKTLFLLSNRMNDSEINNGSFEYSCVGEKASLLIAVRFSETLRIIQRYNKTNERFGTILFLQFELYEVLRNQYPYNLVTCIESIEYWNFFQAYLELFTSIQILMAFELSYLPKTYDEMIDDAYFNRKQSMMDYMFNRVFILVNSIELKYYSSDKEEINYLSCFCALITNYLDQLLISQDADESYYVIIKASMEINIINWVKLSFLCTNNVLNTCNDSLKIETGSIIPKNISKVDFFQGESINGYSVIFCGLKTLYLLLNTTDLSFFPPLVNHTFQSLQVIYCLLSRQDDQELPSCTYLDELKRIKRLLDEVVILFSQGMSRKIICALLSGEKSIVLEDNETSLNALDRLIENSYSIV
ncbi:hypothetical protein OJ253_212 [Cryptosporidium canis]|uniref:Uncharacterized protein n=1 Tax=Cryptosporidium canis TaxID=195482 RepID=A0A9D5DNP4_9CRYT|nr:hypothetical protein OJ253_212 [Cryptosporidium canis]